MPIKGWIKFLENLMENPGYRSRNCLYNFLSHWSAPITEDGCFLAYKNVNNNYTDVHTGTFDNSIGTTVSMPRRDVNDDPNQTCSSGLHVAAPSYLPSFAPGRRTIVCKINPRDVVAVPTDYSHAKMRVCQYEVVDEVFNKSNY